MAARAHPADTPLTPAPGISQAFYEAGLHHLSAHRIAEAMDAFEAALAANPSPEQQAAILYALGNAARRRGQIRNAEDFYGRALSLEPARGERLAALSALHRNNGRYRAAQILLDEALDAEPASPELLLSLAQMLRELGDLERARLLIAEILTLSPDHAAALGSMGELLLDQGQAGTAQVYLAEALKRSPFDARWRYAQAQALLSQGFLAEGWQDLTHRFRAAGRAPAALPAWNGMPIPGKTLLLTAEARLCDQLLFASVIPDALGAAKAGKVILLCPPALAALFARSFPAAEIRKTGEAELHADAALALGDLPRLFRKRLEDFPAAPARLVPDAAASARWRTALQMLGPPPYIGLAWRPERERGQSPERTAPLAAWGGFLRGAGGTLVSAQPDATPEEIAALEQSSGRVLAPGPQRGGLDEAAALLCVLDVMVGVPGPRTALAASLGTKTLKLTFAGSWTALGQDFEPLAPSCRVIKPVRSGDWDEVFSRALRVL
jgi:Tfp pilus assembly protein PilF